MNRFLLSLLFVVLSLTCVRSSVADERVEADARDIYGSIMSPFCPGRLLNDCPSSSATDLKKKIHSELEAGKTKDQVKEELYSTFGSTVRAAPEAKGFGAVAWWMPAVFVVVGLASAVFWLRRKMTDGAGSRPAAAGQAQPQLSEEMKARIEREMRDFNG